MAAWTEDEAAAVEQAEHDRMDPDATYVGVTGTRTYYPEERIYHDLTQLQHRHADALVVVFGDAQGVDRVTWDYVRVLRIRHVRELADWDTQGKRAGHVRNAKVVERVSRLLAYLGPAPYLADVANRSPGTCDAISQALDRGLPVHAWFADRWLSETELASIRAEVHRKRSRR